MKVQDIEKTIELLNYLDGRGIVFEDEDLVREALGEEVEGNEFDA